MNKPKISIIVAMDKNRGIGKNNGLLWHIPDELKRFREITTGHPIIMGRKTYESIGRPLPNRTNIVITRDPEFKAEGTVIVNSLEDAIDQAQHVILEEVQRPMESPQKDPIDSSSLQDDKSEIFIIGGGQIFKQAMDSGMVDKLYVTIVSGDFTPTVYFPEYEDKFPKKVFEKEITAEGTKDGNSETFNVKFLELEK